MVVPTTLTPPTEQPPVDPVAAPRTGAPNQDCAADKVSTGESGGKRTPVDTGRRIPLSRIVAYGLLPTLTVTLAAVAGWMQWQNSSTRLAELGGAQAEQAARDGTIALLSYGPNTVEHDLGLARARLTGSFRDSYTALTNDIVIPGAKQKLVQAIATVPAAGLVSATRNHAVVLVAVNQTTIMGNDAPASTSSSVRVTLDQISGHWLISGFDPV